MRYWGYICLLFLPVIVLGQSQLNNSSFEDIPREEAIPDKWHICAEGTTPDILPGPWNVINLPQRGRTYVGLITRIDGTWESIGQALSKPLEEGQCYTFSLHLAHSDTYAGYNLPITLKIWGGRKACDKLQLLGETKSIDHLNWKEYEFRFQVKDQINYIILEAQRSPGIYFSYRGNILIDNISPFRFCTRASLK